MDKFMCQMHGRTSPQTRLNIRAETHQQAAEKYYLMHTCRAVVVQSTSTGIEKTFYPQPETKIRCVDSDSDEGKKIEQARKKEKPGRYLRDGLPDYQPVLMKGIAP